MGQIRLVLLIDRIFMNSGTSESEPCHLAQPRATGVIEFGLYCHANTEGFKGS